MPKFGEKKIVVCLDKHLHEWVVSEAKRRGMPVSTYIRMILNTNRFTK